MDSESSQPALVERAVDRDRLIVLAPQRRDAGLAWSCKCPDRYGPMSGLSVWMMAPGDAVISLASLRDVGRHDGGMMLPLRADDCGTPP